MKRESRIIAVSQRVIEIASYGETRDCLDQEWTVWLSSLGLTCVPVPNRLPSVAGFLKEIRPRGILLTGGNNLATDVYDGFEDGRPLGDAYPERDDTEMQMIEFAIQESLPLLGCCRGMQMLHAFFGGRLKPLGEDTVPHVASTHEVKIVDASLRALLGVDSVEVNSYHDYGFNGDAVTAPLRPFAVSAEDGIVEGVNHIHLPMMGVMWHPERRNPGAAFDRVIADHLFGSSKVAE